MKQLHITLDGQVLTKSYTPPISLEALLQDLNLLPPMPCAGNHTCGKCKVHVTGALSPMTDRERALLSPQDLANGIRLACFTQVLGDIAITSQAASAVETLCAVTLPPHTFHNSGLGLAVDIGTTTVAMQLYQLETGAILAEAMEGNGQKTFGADVISRIETANQKGTQLLHDTMVQQLQAMAHSCLQQAGVTAVDAAVVTGNTTMLHFLENLDPAGIALAPFTPQSLFDCAGTTPLAGVFPYLPRCIGAYVGADITCSILSSGLLQTPNQTSLLIDMGTNGEIALYHQGQLHCASTAMGPALEGATISCGMVASAGAISSVTLQPDGTVTHTTIGDATAKGICGSGLLDAISVMLKLEVLCETGRLEADAPGVCAQNGMLSWTIPGTTIALTQQDISQVQLAKAAVNAGILSVLHHCNLTPDAVDCFYIAGGFGHYMNLTSAAHIGLFPAPLKDKAVVLGNAALAGTVVLLLDKRYSQTQATISAIAQEIPLSGNAVFSDCYIESMMFDPEFETE